MADRENVISHLQIMHTWAAFALEKDLQFFTEKHMESITAWTDEALELLKEQERQLNEYHKADTFLAVHGFWSDNPPYGVKTSAELERP